MKNKLYAIKTMWKGRKDAYVYVIENDELISAEFTKEENIDAYITCLKHLGYTRAYTQEEHKNNIEVAFGAVEQIKTNYNNVLSEIVLDSKFDKLSN